MYLYTNLAPASRQPRVCLALASRLPRVCLAPMREASARQTRGKREANVHLHEVLAFASRLPRADLDRPDVALSGVQWTTKATSDGRMDRGNSCLVLVSI